jgi:ATP-dependent Lhr-like helicase
VATLRETRRLPPSGVVLAISAADPLNLVGIVTPGERVRSAGRTRVAYRDGIPLAVLEGGVVRELAPHDPAAAAQVERAFATRRRRALALH